jgi:hypothetical protein
VESFQNKACSFGSFQTCRNSLDLGLEVCSIHPVDHLGVLMDLEAQVDPTILLDLMTLVDLLVV